MNRKISFAPGEYYHVYNRGVEKRDIFLSNRDRQRFQSLLYLCNGSRPVVYRLVQGPTLYEWNRGERLVDIGAYCLMPNHFHLLIREKEDGGLTEYLRKVMTAYSMYFNTLYGRVGPLFQGKFKAEHVDKDEYLKYLYAYIHLNPVKLIDPDWKVNGIRDRNAAKAYLEKYRWSSYPDYLGYAREESAILDTAAFPEYFTEPGDFEAYVDGWLKFKQENESAWGNPPPEFQKKESAFDDPARVDASVESSDTFSAEFKEILRPASDSSHLT